ncbi:MAG: hypothetical protein QOJ15_7406, partial [Bradyrhizobium sp.]|nr:hypothetical protein [Bradyrhizobium sp.]
FLRAICSIPFIRNSESRRERLFSRYQHDTNKNTNKSGGWDRTRTNGDEYRCTRKSLFFKGFRALGGRLRTLRNELEQANWCPRPESNPAYDAERDTCLMLDDFGVDSVALGARPDAESGRVTLIRDLLNVQ